ncbi:MAG TPA: deaminase [Bryobacteraceae bacterium]
MAELALGDPRLEKAHAQCVALLDEIKHILEDPRKFLLQLGKHYEQEYAAKWAGVKEQLSRRTLIGDFQAGRITGQVLLDVIMLLLTVYGAAEFAAKVAAEIPELLDLVKGLGGAKDVLEVEKASAAAAGMGDAETVSNPALKRTSVATAGAAPLDRFGMLASRRKALGLSAAGEAGDNATLARLEINGQAFDGINSGLQKPRTPFTLERVNAQTRTHAEAEAVQKAVSAGLKGKAKAAEMWIDRDPCAACGESGGLRSLARNLGVDQLVVHSPSGTTTFTPTK